MLGKFMNEKFVDILVLAFNMFSMDLKFPDAVTTLPGERISKLSILGTYFEIGQPHFFSYANTRM